MKKRFVLLNALPLNAFREHMPIRIYITPITPQQIKEMIESWDEVEVISFIRHPSTVKILSEMLGLDLQPNSGLYSYEPGDSIVVITLKRPPRGQEVQATINDLDIYLVTVEWTGVRG